MFNKRLTLEDHINSIKEFVNRPGYEDARKKFDRALVAMNDGVDPIAEKFYPGTCVKTELGCYWYIKNDKSRLEIPPLAVSSWNFPYIVNTLERNLKSYVKMGKTGYRDGTVVMDEQYKKLYIISGRKKHPIDRSLMEEYGLDSKFIIPASQYILDLHPSP